MSETRKTLSARAMGKDVSVIDAKGRPFPPETQPGTYGKVMLDRTGNLTFESKGLAKSQQRALQAARGLQ